MGRFSILVFTLCLPAYVPAQLIVLPKTVVMGLPCKILKDARGNVAAGFFNVQDSGLYNCRGSFIKTLPGGYIPVDNYLCKTPRLPEKPRKGCRIDYFSSLAFKRGSIELRPASKGVLASAGFLLGADSLCGIKIVGYTEDSAAQKARQLSWDRVNAIINYLVDKQGVAQKRILFSYDTAGPADVVDLIAATVSKGGLMVAREENPAVK
jgi:hypothetical protein